MVKIGYINRNSGEVRFTLTFRALGRLASITRAPTARFLVEDQSVIHSQGSLDSPDLCQFSCVTVHSVPRLSPLPKLVAVTHSQLLGPSLKIARTGLANQFQLKLSHDLSVCLLFHVIIRVDYRGI